MTGRATPVRMLVNAFDPTDRSVPSRRIIALEEPQDLALERLHVLAEVRGYGQLMPELDLLLDRDPPATGYAMFVSEHHALRVIALWPHYDGSLP